MSPLDFIRRGYDTLAAGANAFSVALDRRKASLPRLRNIMNGENLGTEFEELFAAAWSFLFGFWLLLPFDSFGVTKAFRVLAMLSPEWLWALAAIVFGLWRFDAVLMKREATRQSMNLFGVVLWSMMSGMLLLGNFTSTACPLFALVAFLEALSYRNFREESS